jgi:hypothetical protein
MRVLNQRSLARLKRIGRPGIGWIPGVLSSSLIFLAGCAGGMPGMTRITNFFGGASATPAVAASSRARVPASVATPLAAETTVHPGKKTARQAHAASENAAMAPKEAGNASAAAVPASKQAASVANQIRGSGPSNTDVSLESKSAAAEGPAGSRPTPQPSSSASGASIASLVRTTPTLSEPSGPPGGGNPAKAAKLIQDIDGVEKRVDRENLSADDSQRDILAQKLLQEAKKAFAEGDSVAAVSLAAKASTLLEPLPKLTVSAIPSAP